MDLEQVRSQTNKTIVELLSTQYSNLVFIKQKEKLMHNIVEASAVPHPAPLVALAQTKIMLGKAREAIDTVNLIWEMGGKISNVLETLYIHQLNSLGLFSKSLVLLKPKISMYTSARAEFEGFKNSIFNCFIGLGDLDGILKLATLEEFKDKKHLIETFVNQIDKKMLKQHFKTMQEIFNNTTYGKQTGYEVMLDEVDGNPMLEIGFFIGGDSVDRYQLQNQLEDLYANYYEENNLSPLNNFTFSIFDIKKHWRLED